MRHRLTDNSEESDVVPLSLVTQNCLSTQGIMFETGLTGVRRDQPVVHLKMCHFPEAIVVSSFC